MDCINVSVDNNQLFIPTTHGKNLLQAEKDILRSGTAIEGDASIGEGMPIRGWK